MTISTYEFSPIDLQYLIDGLSPEEMNFIDDTMTDWTEDEWDYLYSWDLDISEGRLPNLQGPLLYTPPQTDYSDWTGTDDIPF